jgi:hypothetical protein
MRNDRPIADVIPDAISQKNAQNPLHSPARSLGKADFAVRSRENSRKPLFCLCLPAQIRPAYSGCMAVWSSLTKHVKGFMVDSEVAVQRLYGCTAIVNQNMLKDLWPIRKSPYSGCTPVWLYAAYPLRSTATWNRGVLRHSSIWRNFGRLTAPFRRERALPTRASPWCAWNPPAG